MKKSKLRAGLSFGITMGILFILQHLWGTENFTAKSLLIIIFSGILGGVIAGVLFGYFMGKFVKVTDENTSP